MKDLEALNAEMLAAHAEGNRKALIGLYARAAGLCEGEAKAFYLTHSYIFALEADDPRAPSLRAELVGLGAETEGTACTQPVHMSCIPANDRGRSNSVPR